MNRFDLELSVMVGPDGDADAVVIKRADGSFVRLASPDAEYRGYSFAELVAIGSGIHSLDVRLDTDGDIDPDDPAFEAMDRQAAAVAARRSFG